MLRMEDAVAGMVFQPALSIAPAAEGLLALLPLAGPGPQQRSCQCSTALICQIKIKSADAIGRGISPRQRGQIGVRDESFGGQVGRIQHPRIEREAGG